MDSVIKVYETLSPEETLEVGRELGRTSLAGQVYALVGDLGVGKTVFTKGFAEGLGIGPLKHGSYDILRDDILRQTDGCCKTLGMETLDCLMIHNFEDYEQDPDAISKVFAELKADGRIRLSALSAYSRHDYGVIADSGFDATQIPMNVFDWSQIESGGMKRLSDSGMLPCTVELSCFISFIPIPPAAYRFSSISHAACAKP